MNGPQITQITQIKEKIGHIIVGLSRIDIQVETLELKKVESAVNARNVRWHKPENAL